MKPLFIPLKREFFEAFERGEKTTEYRKYGPRWNERTCTVGREVTLSLGYGNKHRLYGRIAGYSTAFRPGHLPGWSRCYGEYDGPAACITIEIKKPPDHEDGEINKRESQ
jgi:hypothetical protein